MAKSTKKNLPWFSIGIGTVALLGFLKKDTIMEIWNDTVTNNRIAKLHPAIRERAKQFIKAAAEKHGIKLRITSGLRDFAEQQKLYNQGRTAESIAAGEKIVTNAKPGQSFHNYALAIDVVEIKEGKGLWENPNWTKIGAIGKSFGFAWGGDWSSFKDLPHFEYPPGKSVSQLLAMYNAGSKDANGYLTQIA